tara:strand:+ start:351 stop:575 length:225 start_codon:yes stop_codon:yes gene_type:complete
MPNNDFEDSTMFMLGNIDANVNILMDHVKANSDALDVHGDKIQSLEKTRAKMYGGLATLTALWGGLVGYMNFDN